MSTNKKYYLVIFSTLIILLNGIASQLISKPKDTLEVKVINVKELKEFINENKDRPLLINVWATWCAPCRVEFPDLVKLANIYQDKIRVVGISVDDPDDLHTQVIPFLEIQNAEFENYILKVVEPEDFINLLSKNWSGAIPTTFVYDKEGNQTDILIGKQSYALFEEAVKKVID